MVFVSPRRANVIGVTNTTTATDNIVNFFEQLPSSSYMVFDSGYKYIYDKYNDVYRYVPCNGDVAGLCLQTSEVSEPWFSPAGFQRGVLRNAIKLAYTPTKTQRDRLYANRINPIVSFPGQGVVLFGDKTALDLLPHSIESTSVVCSSLSSVSSLVLLRHNSLSKTMRHNVHSS